MVYTVLGTPIGVLTIFVPVLASMGGFIFGYDTGQISSILLMQDFLERFGHCDPDGTCSFGVWQEGAIVGMLSVGTLIGAILGSWFADKLGRRRAMAVECAIFIVGVIIQVTAFTSWAQITVGRGIAGLGVGGPSLAVPAYQAECAPKQIRGSLISLYQLMITLGILVAACINIGTRNMGNSGEWRIPIAIGIVWALALGIGIMFMPESPRWLLAHGYEDEAIRSVARLRGVSKDEKNAYVEQDFREIQVLVDKTAGMREATWADCFRVENKTLYRTILGCVMQSLQQLTGANYFFYYGATIFTSVGLTDGFASQIILNAVNVVCTFLGIYNMERFGRRKPLFWGSLGMAAWLLVFSTAGTAKDPATDSGIGKLMIVSACLFILFYASTWAPGVWILIGETFAYRTRAKQGSLATASNWFWNFCLAFFTSPITGDIGFSYGYIFAGANLFGAFFVYFFLYESAGLPLEAVDAMYKDPNCSPRTSGAWVPPGYSKRNDAAAAVDKMDRGEQTLIEQTSNDTAVDANGHAGEKKAEQV